MVSTTAIMPTAYYVFYTNVCRGMVSLSVCTQKIMSLRGQASSVKMTSHGGKLTAPAFHPTQKINKAEELTCLSTNIFVDSSDGGCVLNLFNL